VRRSQLSARHTEGGGAPGGCRCQLGHGSRLPKERDGRRSGKRRTKISNAGDQRAVVVGPGKVLDAPAARYGHKEGRSNLGFSGLEICPAEKVRVPGIRAQRIEHGVGLYVSDTDYGVIVISLLQPFEGLVFFLKARIDFRPPHC